MGLKSPQTPQLTSASSQEMLAGTFALTVSLGRKDREPTLGGEKVPDCSGRSDFVGCAPGCRKAAQRTCGRLSEE